MEIHTTEFQFAHGKLPRGTGMWAFAQNSFTPADKVFWFTGSYATAKKAAIQHAKEHGWTRIEVRS